MAGKRRIWYTGFCPTLNLNYVLALFYHSSAKFAITNLDMWVPTSQVHGILTLFKRLRQNEQKTVLSGYFFYLQFVLTFLRWPCQSHEHLDYCNHLHRTFDAIDACAICLFCFTDFTLQRVNDFTVVASTCSIRPTAVRGGFGFFSMGRIPGSFGARFMRIDESRSEQDGRWW